MRDDNKVIPMTHKQIRAEFKKMDAKNNKKVGCGLSFSALMEDINSSAKK
jgi:hypothetical protein